MAWPTRTSETVARREAPRRLEGSETSATAPGDLSPLSPRLSSPPCVAGRRSFGFSAVEACWKPQSPGSCPRTPAADFLSARFAGEIRIAPTPARFCSQFASRRSPVRSRLAPFLATEVASFQPADVAGAAFASGTADNGESRHRRQSCRRSSCAIWNSSPRSSAVPDREAVAERRSSSSRAGGSRVHPQRRKRCLRAVPGAGIALVRFQVDSPASMRWGRASGMRVLGAK